MLTKQALGNLDWNLVGGPKARVEVCRRQVPLGYKGGEAHCWFGLLRGRGRSEGLYFRRRWTVRKHECVLHSREAARARSEAKSEAKSTLSRFDIFTLTFTKSKNFEPSSLAFQHSPP